MGDSVVVFVQRREGELSVIVAGGGCSLVVAVMPFGGWAGAMASRLSCIGTGVVEAGFGGRDLAVSEGGAFDALLIVLL